MKIYNKEKGFTLLEVLIALSIFSISSMALLTANFNAIRQVNHVKNTIIANWLAENELKKLYIKRKFPEIGTSGKTTTVHNKSWYIQREVKAVAENFNQVIYRIYKGSAPDSSQQTYSLSGYIGRRKL